MNNKFYGLLKELPELLRILARFALDIFILTLRLCLGAFQIFISFIAIVLFRAGKK